MKRPAHFEYTDIKCTRYCASWLVKGLSRTAEALAGLKNDLDNIRRAWGWAVAQNNLSLLKQVIEPPAAFYEFSGLLAEGEQVFETASQQLSATATDQETEKQMAAILTAILNNPVPDLLKLRPDTPPAPVELINYMLVKERNGRIDSMRQVAAGLEVIRRS